MMNPYESDPDKIPSTDRYADVPFYGRYLPRPTDFEPDAKHVNSTAPESLNYWSTVLAECTELNRIYENDEGGRDVFALGSVIIKSSHLKVTPEGRRSHRDYSYADANEVEAIRLAKKILDGIKVPQVYFAAKINGRDVFVQERIPGVSLNIAWQYISQSQKASFKEQARQMLQKLRTITPPNEITRRSYIVPDPDPVHHRGIQEVEKEIIFADEKDSDLSFMHNDVSLSNCIVDNDKIVGLIDWEMAGWFGWKTAANVHVRIRTPKRENFASLDLPEEMLSDILFWNDLYDVK
ncbi:kinase-like domain-containing protein [Hypoxylon cercidicola]|nr:kinase-like domain-containing protein [Hypoxylon cercidicola]